MGGRLISQDKLMVNGSVQCNNNKTGVLYHMYCTGPNVSESDPDCQYLLNNEVALKPGIPGLASGVILGK